MKIKAALVREYNKPMTIETIDIDTPGPYEVRVETKASGICHSDLSVFRGIQPPVPYPLPIVLGHEPAGIVDAVGSEISTVKVGDHVALCTSGYCGKCRQCMSGLRNMCSNPEGILHRQEGETPRLSLKGELILQLGGLSSFAEMMLVHETNVVKIDDDLPFDSVSVVGCAVTTGTGAALNTAKVTPGSSVVVFGVGGIGISIIQGARIAGARQIIAVDLFDYKLEAAKRDFGATHTINGSKGDNVVEKIQRLSNGGVDFAFDAAGSQEIVKQLFYCCTPGGVAVVVGAPHPLDGFMEVPVWEFAFEKKLIGCYMGSNNWQVENPRYLELYKQGRLNLDDMVSSRISLEEVNDTLRAMQAGEVMNRTVIMFD